MTAAPLSQNVSGQRARVVGHVDLPDDVPAQARDDSTDFLAEQAAAGWQAVRPRAPGLPACGASLLTSNLIL